MNSSDNIKNAFNVVSKTYENIYKMMEYCKKIADDNNYTLCSNKFLRYKSDSEYRGWTINNFILLFQNKDDKENEDGWRSGPIYALEIDFSEDTKPTVYLSKYQHTNMATWKGIISPADHWRYYWPTRKEEYFNMEKQDEYEIYLPQPGSESIREKHYWKLYRVVRYSEDLLEINESNIKDKIFKRFDELKGI